MFVAVCSGSSVCVVDTSESSSLDTMSRLASRGMANLSRIVVSAQRFIDYSEGANLVVQTDVVFRELVHRLRL